MSIFSYVKSHIVVVSVASVSILCVAVIAGRAASQKAPLANKANEAKVTLVNAATFRTGSLIVSADGTVQSHAQADLRSQISAPVAVVHVSIGETVYPGEVITELQNSDIRAGLAQAQAALVLAQGQYESTRQGAIDKIKSAYLAADSAIHSQIDPLITNSNSQPQPVLYSYVSDPQLGFKIKEERTDLTVAFTTWKPLVNTLSASSTDTEIHDAIAASQKNLDAVGALLDNVSSVLNNAANTATPATQATVNGYATIVTAARNSISAASSNLTAAATTITDGTSGSTPIQAELQVAEAGVANFKAQLAKTIITSPLTGKISALPLRPGELASPGTLLATVVGDTAHLEIKAFVSSDDLVRIAPGQNVSIGSAAGVVSNVAPSVDAVTKKAEVDVDVADSSRSGLVIGQNVSVSIHTSRGEQTPPSTASSTGPVTYVLPIQDVKIIPGSAYVFTVDENSKIKENPVTLGTIRGDFVEVVSGMDDSMNIVTPVYELDPGQEVVTQ